MNNNDIHIICKSSAIEAVTVLSKFLNKPIEFKFLPQEINLKDKFDLTLPHENNIVSLFLMISGNITGYVFLLFSEFSALKICNLSLNNSSEIINNFGDMSISLLSEIANILVGNFLSEFSTSLHLDYVVHNVSIFDNDTVKNTKEKIFNIIMTHPSIFLRKINFCFKHLDMQGEMLFFLDEDLITESLK